MRKLIALSAIAVTMVATSTAQARSEHAWIQRALLCIHHYEGAWNAIDRSGTHFGGLQMDKSFQQTYGWTYYRRWGTANRWPVWAQLDAGERAVHVRGFNPWPTTRHYCNL